MCSYYSGNLLLDKPMATARWTPPHYHYGVHCWRPGCVFWYRQSHERQQGFTDVADFWYVLSGNHTGNSQTFPRYKEVIVEVVTTIPKKRVRFVAVVEEIPSQRGEALQAKSSSLGEDDALTTPCRL